MHESVVVRGPVGRLRGDMEHYPYADISDHLRKIDSYTTLWARQAHAAGRRSNVVDMMAGASWAFFRNYVLKRGFAPRQRGPHRLRAQHALHVRQAREAPRAGGESPAGR